MKKTFAFLIALVLAMTVCFSALADLSAAEYAAQAKRFATDYTGKTIILHSNDVHGAIEGYAYMPKLKEWFLERGASDVLLVDVGDFAQGTTYVTLSKGASAVELMNAAGYNYVTLGNHEFDYGYAQLMENLKEATFTTLCSNVLLENGESILPAIGIWTAPEKAAEEAPAEEQKEGEAAEPAKPLTIGFVGVETPETATKVTPSLIKEIRFTSFDELYKNTQESVDALKAQDVDLVIGLFHLGVDAESKPNGYRSIDVLEKVSGIDFVIDGHSHTVMTQGENGEPIQSTGTKFANIGVVVIDDEAKAITDHFLVDTTNLEKDEAVAAKAKEIKDKVDAEYGAVFARSEVLLNGDKAPGNRTEETNNGDLITDAMIWSVVKEGGIEQVEPNHVVGITNGGGIRAPIQVGDVTRNDIVTVLPFGNTVAVIYVTGHELLEALEASTFCTPDPVGGYPQTSGIRWTLDTTKEFDKGEVYMLYGKDTSYFAPASIQRVSIQEINGEPFDPEATYAVVTNNFIMAGGDTYNAFFRAYDAGAGFDTGITMDQVVMDYITDVLNGVITEAAYGQPQGRLTVK